MSYFNNYVSFQEFRRILDKIQNLQTQIIELEVVSVIDIKRMIYEGNSDGALTTTQTAPKRLSLQYRESAPSNAAYIEFSNSPSGGDFYLVLEDA